MLLLNLARVVTGIICIWSMYIMTKSYYKNHTKWNAKTIDYWYGRLMWTVVGLAACIEGLIRQSPFRYSFVLLMAAVIVTFKANVQRGSWGNDEKDYYDQA